MKFDFAYVCDQLDSTNHSLLFEVSSLASCQHILTKCTHSCTYMDTLPLIEHLRVFSFLSFSNLHGFNDIISCSIKAPLIIGWCTGVIRLNYSTCCSFAFRLN